MTKTMKIDGMKCVKCAGRVEKALNAIEGVKAQVNLEAASAACECAAEVTDEMLTKAVADAGFTVVSVQ